MLIILFAIHCLIAIALVGVVLLQKSEGGALGIGGGGGMSSFMTGRSTANLLTRTTAILAAIFFATSILLFKFSTNQHAPTSILDLGPGPTAPMVPNPLSPPNPAAAPNAQRNIVGKAAPATPAAGTAKPAPATGTAKPAPAAPVQPAGPSVPLAK